MRVAALDLIRDGRLSKSDAFEQAARRFAVRLSQCAALGRADAVLQGFEIRFGHAHGLLTPFRFDVFTVRENAGPKFRA